MGDGGFRYFLEKGIVYGNAHHAHANTETIVGHATLATGAHPSAHGMIGNIWFDRGSGSLTYNIEDSRYGLLTEGVALAISSTAMAHGQLRHAGCGSCGLRRRGSLAAPQFLQAIQAGAAVSGR